MPSCVIKHCKSCSQKQKQKDGISFHKLPTEIGLREKWVSVIRQSRNDNNWQASKYCVVCSLHFKEDDFSFTVKGRRLIKKESKPTINLAFSEISDITESLMNPVTLEDQTDSSKSLQINKVSGVSIHDNPFEPEVRDLDLESIFDTSRGSQLRKKLRKRELLQVYNKKKIKILQQKIRRLQKRNVSLQKIIRKIMCSNKTTYCRKRIL